MAQKHEFAIYVAEVSKQVDSTTLRLTDAAVLMRIHAVLRLQPGETCILFDAHIHARCVIRNITKKYVDCDLLEKKENPHLRPEIICLLPLLKRDDLETALYAAVELGATMVQLVLTEKVQRAWGGAKEFERLQRIMIAAAEQSKNFAVPKLHEPQDFASALTTIPFNATKLFFDVGGKAALQLMQELAQQKPSQIVMLVGPEADLTEQEKSELARHKFIMCELTPTILRAVSAYALGLGMLRSLIK